MTDRPILFSGPMVRAILDGRKTVTRRVIGPSREPEPGHAWRDCCCADIDPSDTPCLICEARYQVRFRAWDRLWVRETWADGIPEGPPYRYRATNDDGPEPPKWRPSIFMPRAACRLHLEIVRVGCDLLQDATEEDATREGTASLAAFAALWDSINGKRPGCSWNANPLVWRIEFVRSA